MLLASALSTAQAQRIRLPNWSPERPDVAAASDTGEPSVVESGGDALAREPARLAQRVLADVTDAAEAADGELDINFELPDEPRVASRSGPATLDLGAMSIADGFIHPNGIVHPDGIQGNCANCPAPRRRFGLFAEGLYLRPGGANVVYAIEQTGCDPTSTPTGQVGETSLDRDGGLRVGGSMFLRSGAELVATYTWLTNDTQSNVVAQTGTVLASQVTHPSLASCGTNSLSASASQGIDQHLIDLDYRAPICFDCSTEVRYLAGIRYAQFDQGFSAQQMTGVATGLATVGTEVSFDGLGFRMGLEGLRSSPNSGLFVYGRGVANFLAGEFNARYSQVNQFGGAVPVRMNSEDYRIVSLLEAELGVGWQSRGGRWRLSTGYQVNAWFNALTAGDYIRGVRAGNIDDLRDTVTFDGLVAQVEWRR